MSIELKQAAQQTLEAIQDLRGYRPDIDKAIEALRAALAAQPAEGGEVCNVKSSAGLIRPGKVDAWVANHYTNPPASQERQNGE